MFYSPYFYNNSSIKNQLEKREQFRKKPKYIK